MFNLTQLTPARNGTLVRMINFAFLEQCFMSALGHMWTAPWQELSDAVAALVGWQTCAMQNGMTALPPNSDIDRVFRHVCFGPEADLKPRDGSGQPVKSDWGGAIARVWFRGAERNGLIVT